MDDRGGRATPVDERAVGRHRKTRRLSIAVCTVATRSNWPEFMKLLKLLCISIRKYEKEDQPGRGAMTRMSDNSDNRQIEQAVATFG